MKHRSLMIRRKFEDLRIQFELIQYMGLVLLLVLFVIVAAAQAMHYFGA